MSLEIPLAVVTYHQTELQLYYLTNIWLTWLNQLLDLKPEVGILNLRALRELPGFQIPIDPDLSL